jgi:predicted Zn-dependent protease
MHWSRERTQDLLARCLVESPADEIEAVFQAQDYGLTRFAGSTIHQNMSEEDAMVVVRVAFGQQLGSFATNQLDTEGLRGAVKRAAEIARLSHPTPNFHGFCQPMQPGKVNGEVYFPATAEVDAARRANRAADVIQTAGKAGFEAAGAVSNGVYVCAVATSRGQNVYQAETRSHGLTVVNRPGEAGFGTGYAEWYGRDFDKFDPFSLGQQAVDISVLNHDPAGIEPGNYAVILSPMAVGLLLFYLSWMGFHARSVQSGQSFLIGKKSKLVLSDSISIWDDGLDGSGYAVPFDWEGVPKQRVDIIQDGLARDVVYDSFTAAHDACRSSGHCLSPVRDQYYSSPLPSNLFIAPGGASKEELIASTERGILIEHLWYVREVHYGNTIVTGMTRDGTFLIENGRITRPLCNLRFTQSIAEAFRSVQMVGRDLHLAEQFIGVSVTPALKVERFNIAGISTF